MTLEKNKQTNKKLTNTTQQNQQAINQKSKPKYKRNKQTKLKAPTSPATSPSESFINEHKKENIY